MTIDKVKLLSALKQVLPGVDTGTTLINGADSFVFYNGRIYTFNDFISVSIPFETEKPLNGSVKAMDFFSLISKLSDKELKLAESDSSWLIKSGNIKVEFTVMQSAMMDYIKKLIPEEIVWNPVPADFFKFMKYCILSKNYSNLSGIFVNDTVMVSTDEMRINYFPIKSSMNPFWISMESVKELLNMEGIEEYSITDSWVNFKNKEGVLFSCKKLNTEKYPISTVTALIEQHSKVETDVSGELPSLLPEAVNRASSLATDIDNYNAVKLEFTKGHISVSSERASGKYQEKVSWDKKPDKDFDPVTIYIDYNMINSGLSIFKKFYIKKTVNKSNKEVTRFIFENESGIQLVSTLINK